MGHKNLLSMIRQYSLRRKGSWLLFKSPSYPVHSCTVCFYKLLHVILTDVLKMNEKTIHVVLHLSEYKGHSVTLSCPTAIGLIKTEA
jgi:hypothetical protein